MKPEPKYVAETLVWCNARRKEQRKRALKKLPKGGRSDPYSCPCGAATGLAVEEEYFFRPGEASGSLLPRAVQRFVAAFDAGSLPQYDADLAPPKAEA